MEVSEWDEHAADWDDDPAARAYAEAAFASLERALAAAHRGLDDLVVCDFGCGTGLLTERLARRCHRIDAVDSSTAMLERLNAKIDRLDWSNVTTMGELSSADERYDLIVCSSVLAFVDDHPTTVRELAERLRPGGMLVHWDWALDPDEEEPFGLTEHVIRSALESAGLGSVHVGLGFEAPFEDQVMQPLMGMGTARG